MSTEFSCPENMRFWSDLVFAGEYDIPGLELPVGSLILDVGANCGAFALWANKRWPGRCIRCYEPSHTAYTHLQHNTEGSLDIQCFKKAIVADGKTKLYFGRDNLGQSGFYPELGEVMQEYELPPLMHPTQLPAAQLIKIDTEGCELEIILGLARAKRLPEVIMLEYHRDFDRRAIDIELRDYLLVGSSAKLPHRGVVKYVRKQQ